MSPRRLSILRTTPPLSLSLHYLLFPKVYHLKPPPALSTSPFPSLLLFPPSSPLSPSSSLWRFSFIGGCSGRYLTSPPSPVFLLPPLSFSPSPFLPPSSLHVLSSPQRYRRARAIPSAIGFSTYLPAALFSFLLSQIDERVLLRPTYPPAGLFVNHPHLHPFLCVLSPTGGCARPAFSFRWAKDVEKRRGRE